MSMRKSYVRDFDHNIIGNVTTGFDEGHVSIVRDNSGHVLGRVSNRFNETRDSSGHVVSSNAADSGLLIRKK